MIEEFKCRQCLKNIKVEVSSLTYLDVGYNSENIIMIQCPYCDYVDFYLEH